jgi:hypothetical protein
VTRIDWKAVIPNVAAIALGFDPLQCVVARLAKAPQGAGAEGVPTPAMRRMMIGYRRAGDAAFRLADGAQGLDLKLMTSPLFP